jgi:hypothetical protein
MGTGHVFHEGAVALGSEARMCRDPVALVQHLNRLGREPNVQDLSHECVRDTVEPLVEAEVIVKSGFGLAPLSVLIGCVRQGLERWSIQLFVEIPATDGLPLEVTLIQVGQQFGNSLVEVRKGEEGMVPQAGQYPAFDHLHCDLGVTAHSEQ